LLKICGDWIWCFGKLYLGFLDIKKLILKGMNSNKFATPEKFAKRRSFSANWVGGTPSGVAAAKKCEILEQSIRSLFGKNNIAENTQVFNSNARSMVKKLSN
jgi:hypothetical protein